MNHTYSNPLTEEDIKHIVKDERYNSYEGWKLYQDEMTLAPYFNWNEFYVYCSPGAIAESLVGPEDVDLKTIYFELTDSDGNEYDMATELPFDGTAAGWYETVVKYLTTVRSKI